MRTNLSSHTKTGLVSAFCFSSAWLPHGTASRPQVRHACMLMHSVTMLAKHSLVTLLCLTWQMRMLLLRGSLPLLRKHAVVDNALLGDV